MDEVASVQLNGEMVPLGAGFVRLMDGVAVALTATDVETAAQMYLRLGEGVRFAEMIELSKRVEAQRLVLVVREKAAEGLVEWVDRFGAPTYEVTHALGLLDDVVRYDYGQVEEAMRDADTPLDVGWTLAFHLSRREQALERDVIPRDIVRTLTKTGINGALEMAREFEALPLDREAIARRSAAPSEPT